MNDLAEDFLNSKLVPPGRKVWTLPPISRAARRTILFLDAEIYRDSVEAPAVLRELEQAGSIEPALGVFVSLQDSAARHVDFACSRTYSRFLADELLPWLNVKHPQLADKPLTLVGLSLSGLAVAFAAMQYPERFPVIISQSPSMWWNDEWFRRSSGQPGPRSRFWISVGNQETAEDVKHPPTDMHQKTSQIDSCRRAWETLKQRGYEVTERIFEGGHDPTCWREDLALALPWAMKAF